MAWDSSRPVPWGRLVREWTIYAVIMTVVFLVFFRGDNVIGAVAGVLISGPLYLGVGAVLAKFGYTRTRWKDLRAQAGAGAPSTASPDGAASGATRAKPAATSRTGGSSRPASKGKRR